MSCIVVAIVMAALMMSCRYPEVKRTFGVLETMVVAKGQTVQLNSSVLQLPKSHPGRHYSKRYATAAFTKPASASRSEVSALRKSSSAGDRLVSAHGSFDSPTRLRSSATGFVDHLVEKRTVSSLTFVVFHPLITVV